LSPWQAVGVSGIIAGMTEVQPTILLVEDNEDDQILIRTAFELAGIRCDITTMSTAEDAIAFLSANGNESRSDEMRTPTAALIDLSLPGKSGHDLLKWIQSRRELKNLVRVVLSGSDNPEDVDKSYQLGAHGYLMKPLTAEQLNRPGRTLKTILLQMSALPQAV